MEIKDLNWTKCLVLDNCEAKLRWTQKSQRTCLTIAFKTFSQLPYNWSLNLTRINLENFEGKLGTRYEINQSESQANGFKVQHTSRNSHEPKQFSAMFHYKLYRITKPINTEPNPNLCRCHQTHPIILCRYALNLFLIFFFLKLLLLELYFWDFCFWYF